MASSSLLSASVSALIWVVISLVTGSTVVFAIVGGLLCGVVAFVIGYAFRRLFLSGRFSD